MYPWLLHSPHFQLPTYATCLFLGAMVALSLLRREALREGIAPRIVLDMALIVACAAWLGARTAYWILASPTIRNDFGWLDFLFGGGLKFYGGLFAGIIAVWIYGRLRDTNPWTLADLCAAPAAIVVVFGRIGCWAAGCCYGKAAAWPAGWSIPWAVRYEHNGIIPADLVGEALHPTPLYGALWGLGLFVYLSYLRKNQAWPGQAILVLIAGYGLGRIIVDLFRGDLLPGVSQWIIGTPSQWLGLTSACVAIGLLIWKNRTHVLR